ncbi:MAG TPA: PIN domain-containing protein [Vicinamibacterales bacterium]|nr:PIN domain-containing protein [Vicinamibacterales bacterium]
MRAGELVFVDTGAWLALALTRDPLHKRARAVWEQLVGAGAGLHTSVPVVLETFTFLDRNTARSVAVAWKDSLGGVARLKILPATTRDLQRAWSWFDRPDLHKLSAVDAVSFVLMAERRIRVAFAFDSHFAAAGFRMVG